MDWVWAVTSGGNDIQGDETSSAEISLGTLLVGRYRLVECVKRSTHRSTFEAFQDDTQRRVQVDVFGLSSPLSSEAQARLSKRVQLCRRLHHANLVQVLDGGCAEQGLFLVSKLQRGSSLHEYMLERGPMHPREAASVGLAVAQGLIELHRVGLVHAGVRPKNIVLHESGPTEIQVKLAGVPIESLIRQIAYSDGPDRESIQTSARWLASEMRQFSSRALLEATGKADDLHSLGSVLSAMVGLADEEVGVSSPGNNAGNDTTTSIEVPENFLNLVALSREEGAEQNHAARFERILVELNDIAGGYRLGRAVPDGAGAGRGVVPRSDERRGHRGGDARQSHGTGEFGVQGDESSEARSRRIEESLLTPLAKPKRDPFGVTVLFLILVGLGLWWVANGM